MKCKKLVAMALTAAMFLSAGTGVFAGKSTVKKRGDSISARTNHSYSDDDDDWAEDEGQCGDNLRWSFDESTGTLTFTGSGDMWNYYNREGEPTPWSGYYDYNDMWRDNARKKIKNVVFNGNITSIGRSAFAGCVNLKTIQIPDTIKFIGSYAFEGCPITEINIPASVSHIETHLDMMMPMLSAAGYVMPSIGSAAGALMKINVDPSNPYYSSVDGVLFDKNKRTIVIYPSGRKGPYTIPDTVTCINEEAFAECENLTDITIPNSVKRILMCAFECCYGLKNVTIPNSVEFLEYGAFGGCASLESVVIPKSVKAISSEVFVWKSEFGPDFRWYDDDEYDDDDDEYYDDDDEDDDDYWVAIKDIYYEGTEAEWNSIRTYGYFDEEENKDVYADELEEDERYDFHDDYKNSTIHFNYKPAAALAITQQPANQTINLGESVKLSVKAEGTGLSYQWYYKKAGQTAWSVWKEHTHATETATPNATWDGIQLYCEVKDSSGNTVNSNAAKITVKLPVSITQQPANQTIKLGDSVKLTVKAEGTGLSYQWYFKKAGQTAWSVWKGRTHATETATPNATWDGIQLYCKVTDNAGNSLNSSTATITFGSSGVTITQHPSNVTVAAGSNVTFTVKATGSGLKYQWQYKKKGATSWSDWNGRTTASTTATANATWDGMQVRCKVTDGSGNYVFSNAATVTIVSSTLAITTQPTNQYTVLGKSVTLSVKATGSGLTYQWYFKKKGQSSFSVWNGRTHASETVTPNDTWDGIQLYCLVKDGGGASVKSSTITVSVLSITTQPANVTVAVGANATFTVKATGSGLKYQWQYKKKGAADWSNWGSRTTASTTATANDTWDGMQVRCKVTDGAGNYVFSNAATITIK